MTAQGERNDTGGAAAAASFEEALARLGEIVARLEAGSLGLSASIAAYEEGVALLRRLHEELASAEARVSLLVRIDDEGRPVLADLAGADAAAADPPPKRTGRGRSGGSRPLPGMEEESRD